MLIPTGAFLPLVQKIDIGIYVIPVICVIEHVKSVAYSLYSCELQHALGVRVGVIHSDQLPTETNIMRLVFSLGRVVV